MDLIEEIYNSDVYYSFLLYCRLHGYRTMADLLRCPFEQLSQATELSPSLINRIKTTFYLYCKKHPDLATHLKKAKPAAAQQQEGLEEQVEAFFRQNPDRLIHISEINKALKKKVKREELVTLLEQASWCRIVDPTTFFYVPNP